MTYTTPAALVRRLQEAEQDFEFYPTTNEIIQKVIKDAERWEQSGYGYGEHSHTVDSVLDIGAGDGKVLKAFGAMELRPKLYGIEKSAILCGRLAKVAYIVGTSLYQQSLLSKTMDVTFCNPPYKEYQQWSAKIIRETASKLLYLVIPRRWEQSQAIKDALKYRGIESKALGEYSFEDAEDRTARAMVNIVRVDFSKDDESAFDKFFDEQFSHLKKRYVEESKTTQAKAKKFTGVVSAKNYVEALALMYSTELQKIQRNYEMASGLDIAMLQELDVSPTSILECLKGRLSGLKNEYWQELFSNMEKVTDRLTTKKRRNLLDTLNKNGHVDFTVDNVYAVVVWALEHANEYIGEQMLEVFDDMVDRANVKNYKSNHKVLVQDCWRYRDEKPTHIALEFRWVLAHCGGINKSEWSFENGLAERAADFLNDVICVARTLGFEGMTQDRRLVARADWTSGRKEIFTATYGEETIILMEVKGFYNGNLHVRFNQKFALALNVEVGRLRGWLKTAQEAGDELDDPQAIVYFNSTLRLGAATLPQLSAARVPRKRKIPTA